MPSPGLCPPAPPGSLAPPGHRPPIPLPQISSPALAGVVLVVVLGSRVLGGLASRPGPRGASRWEQGTRVSPARLSPFLWMEAGWTSPHHRALGSGKQLRLLGPAVPLSPKPRRHLCNPLLLCVWKVLEAGHIYVRALGELAGHWSCLRVL